MNKFHFFSIHLGIIILGVVVIINVFPSAHYLGGIYLPVDKEDIENRANELFEYLEIDTTDRPPVLSVRSHRQLYTHVLKKHGIKEGNALLRDSISAFYWNIRLGSLDFEDGIIDDHRDQDIEDITDLMTNINVQIDGHGNIRQFRSNLSDTVYLPTIETDSARILVDDFLLTFTRHRPENLSLISHREINLEHRRDHVFRFEPDSDTVPITYTIEMSVAGNVISDYNLDFASLHTGPSGTTQTISILSSTAPYFIVGIMMLVIGFKRIRSNEIGFKNALILGIISGVFVGLYLLLQLINEMNLMILIPLIFGPLLIGGFVVFVVAVSEAVGRQTWKEKFIPFDLLSNGHILHSVTGKSYIRGIAYGTGIFAVSLVLTALADSIYPMWYHWVQSDPLEGYTPPFVSIKILLNELWLELIAFSVMLLFVVSYLRQRTSNVTVLLVLGALFYGIMDWSNSFPATGGIIIASFYGALFVWIMYRFDVITGYLTVLCFSLAGEVSSLLMTGNSYFAGEGLIIASVFGLLFIGGTVAQFTRDRITDYDDIAPVFQKYISERERLQRELEIAHEVQMSFLPKEKPAIASLDIASTCIPAHEVGGDYYDFIHINDHLFGIVIGDVSGKGTRASFYMTLTKGILRSTARNETNPAEVLKKVNRTFYESADRGAFVSMVYGIFDMNTKTLTVARAGHNPVILWKSAQANGDILNPQGIALGLDNGTVFDESIREMSVTFEANDLFIFFTDGFSEATNKKQEEFGDTRLYDAARSYHSRSAEEILNNIIAETNNFTGRTPQHDDMTMVVVKVSNE